MTFKTSSKRCDEIDAASKAEEHLMSGITHPGLHDCLCGRGGHATNHPGNVQFRMLVSKYKDYYMGLSRYGKLQVAAEVVKLWRSQTPAGRFLAMTDPSNRYNTSWHDIGDKEAIKKTSQCLRERIPPHQKARTLDLVTKKVKTVENPSKMCNSSVGSIEEDCIAASLSGESMTMQQTFQARSIQETPLVSLSSTPISPNAKREVSVPASLPDFAILEGSVSPSPLPLRDQQSNSPGNRKMMESWDSTGIVSSSSMCCEDFSWMADALTEDEPMNDTLNSSNNNKSSSHSSNYSFGKTTTTGADKVDGSQIPSAANLTMDVFDDDVYKPLIKGTTNTFGKQDWSSGFNLYSTSAPATTLNDTLSQNRFSF